MAKIKEFRYTSQGVPMVSYLYHCPGCNTEHSFGTDKHTFNGDLENPTITPSLFKNWEPVCHSFITNGKIQFCDDSWHELRGKTVDLPEIEAD